MEKLKETLSLLLTRVLVFCFNLIEEGKVRVLFYKNPAFKKVDKALKKEYKGTSPYLISKNFLEKVNADDIYTYGETPLSALYKALKKCDISKDDIFFDLGCGRGRAVLFVSSFFSVTSIGIERVPLFCTLANKVAKLEHINASFLQEDLAQADLSRATIIYFLPLLIEKKLIDEIIKKAPKTATIITASIPLSEHSQTFSSEKIDEALFPWGRATLYKNCKKNLQKL